MKLYYILPGESIYIKKNFLETTLRYPVKFFPMMLGGPSASWGLYIPVALDLFTVHRAFQARVRINAKKKTDQ